MRTPRATSTIRRIGSSSIQRSPRAESGAFTGAGSAPVAMRVPYAIPWTRAAGERATARSPAALINVLRRRLAAHVRQRLCLAEHRLGLRVHERDVRDLVHPDLDVGRAVPKWGARDGAHDSVVAVRREDGVLQGRPRDHEGAVVLLHPDLL